MVSGMVLYSDSTHIKANANKQKFTKEEVSREAKWYVDELDKAVTDPDSGHIVRDRKPKGFFYLDHRTVDSKYNIITDKGKSIYKRHKETIERSFADSKELHGLVIVVCEELKMFLSNA